MAINVLSCTSTGLQRGSDLPLPDLDLSGQSAIRLNGEPQPMTTWNLPCMVVSPACGVAPGRASVGFGRLVACWLAVILVEAHSIRRTSSSRTTRLSIVPSPLRLEWIGSPLGIIIIIFFFEFFSKISRILSHLVSQLPIYKRAPIPPCSPMFVPHGLVSLYLFYS